MKAQLIIPPGGNEAEQQIAVRNALQGIVVCQKGSITGRSTTTCRRDKQDNNYQCPLALPIFVPCNTLNNPQPDALIGTNTLGITPGTTISWLMLTSPTGQCVFQWAHIPGFFGFTFELTHTEHFDTWQADAFNPPTPAPMLDPKPDITIIAGVITGTTTLTHGASSMIVTYG